MTAIVPERRRSSERDLNTQVLMAQTANLETITPTPSAETLVTDEPKTAKPSA